MRDAVSENFSTALREFLNMFLFLRVIYYYTAAVPSSQHYCRHLHFHLLFRLALS